MGSVKRVNDHNRDARKAGLSGVEYSPKLFRVLQRILRAPAKECEETEDKSG